MRREHTNYLMQCWKRRRFGDGVKFLGRPLRVALYRLRRSAGRAGAAGDPAAGSGRGEALDGRVHGVFAEPPRCGEALPCDARLRAEVEGQLRGVYRLAGGAYRQLMAAGAGEVSLSGLTDGEDVHCWHRLYWAVRYARAAWAGHDRALEALRGQLTAWLDGRKSGEADAAYTLAERICSIAEVLFWASTREPGLTEEFRLKLKQQARRDARLGSVLGSGRAILNLPRAVVVVVVVVVGQPPEAALARQMRKPASPC